MFSEQLLCLEPLCGEKEAMVTRFQAWLAKGSSGQLLTIFLSVAFSVLIPAGRLYRLKCVCCKLLSHVKCNFSSLSSTQT